MSKIQLSTASLPYLERMNIVHKYNTAGRNDNFFFDPAIALTLRGGKVLRIDKNSLTLRFPKNECYLLYSLLCKSNEAIYKNIKSKFDLVCEKQYSMLFDTPEEFHLRLYLPKKGNHYLIKRTDVAHSSSTSESFVLPRVGAVLDEADIEIKNIWCKNSVAGYNIELKSVKYFF